MDSPPVIEPVDSVPRRPVWREVAGLLAVGLELLVLLCAAEWVFRWLQEPGWWTESIMGPKRLVRYPFETPAWLVTFGVGFFVLMPTLRWCFGGWGPVQFGVPRLGGGRWLRGFRQAGVLMALSLLLSHAGFLLFPELMESTWRAYGIHTREDFLVFMIIGVGLGAAVGEELTFRCYLQGTFQELSPSWGPLAAAGLFASLHLFQGWLPVLAFHLPGALIIATIYRGSRCIVALITMHLMFDLEAFWLLRTVHLSPDWRIWLPLAGVAVGAAWLVLERRTLVEIAKELGRILRGLTDRWWLWIPGFVALLGGVGWASKVFLLAGARKVIYEDSTIALLLSGGLALLVLLRTVIGRGRAALRNAR